MDVLCKQVIKGSLCRAFFPDASLSNAFVYSLVFFHCDVFL